MNTRTANVAHIAIAAAHILDLTKEELIEAIHILWDKPQIPTIDEALESRTSKDELLATLSDTASVDDLDLFPRTRNILTTNGYWTVGEIVMLSERSFLRLPNAGKASLRNLKEQLKAHGLSLSSTTRPVKNVTE